MQTICLHFSFYLVLLSLISTLDDTQMKKEIVTILKKIIIKTIN